MFSAARRSLRWSVATAGSIAMIGGSLIGGSLTGGCATTNVQPAPPRSVRAVTLMDAPGSSATSASTPSSSPTAPEPGADSRPASSRPAHSQPAHSQPEVAPPADPEAVRDAARAKAGFEIVAASLERTGVYRTPLVYTVAVPRDDLAVIIEGMPVPTEAGLESVFHFYFCPCGKMNVVGQFCVLDYEANDVVDALRAARIEIASMAPMVLHARQSPVLIRFFAEGDAKTLADAIRKAIRWTGRERMR